MLDAATKGGVGRHGYVERPQIETYLRRGYLPLPTTSCHGSVPAASISLEWSVDDFAISQFAAALDDSKIASEFQNRAQYWQHLFNPTTHSIQPRNALGFFPAGPAVVPPGDDCFSQVGFDEGNAEQYVWYVPQNIAGLVTALGGRQAVADRLDKFTSQLNVGPEEPYLWAGNEPNFLVPWLYNYIGQPWKTQAIGRPGAQHAIQPHARRRAGQRRPGCDVGVVCVGGDGLVSQRPRNVDADREHTAVRSHRNCPSRRQIHSDHRAGCVRTPSPAVHQRLAHRWAVDRQDVSSGIGSCGWRRAGVLAVVETEQDVGDRRVVGAAVVRCGQSCGDDERVAGHCCGGRRDRHRCDRQSAADGRRA